jgi:hypothetical protein
VPVTVLNNGIPLSGVAVAFTAPASGASATLSSGTAITNASAVASVVATANFVAGNYLVTASYQGQTATFSLTNTVYAFLTASGGTPQSIAVNSAFPSVLQATVKDTLGNAVGDGNAFANWLVWSHGGYLVDEAGKVAINSKETLAALNYLKDLYATFVPGTLAWGDPSNNRAYAANEVWLTANGVSLYFALKNDAATRPIAEDTDHALMPFGIVGRAPQASTTLNAMVFRHTKFPNAAKSYLQFMMESEQYDPWLTGCLGYWSHTLRAYGQSAVWASDPKLAVYRNGTENQFWSGYKGPISHAAGTVAAEYIMVQMCASVASGQATPEEAAKEAERRTRRYYR